MNRILFCILIAWISWNFLSPCLLVQFCSSAKKFLQFQFSAVLSVDMDITFIFIVQKDQSAMVKWKQLYYAANTASALCKQLHRQHANSKLDKNPEWH